MLDGRVLTPEKRQYDFLLHLGKPYNTKWISGNILTDNNYYESYLKTAGLAFDNNICSSCSYYSFNCIDYSDYITLYKFSLNKKDKKIYVMECKS